MMGDGTARLIALVLGPREPKPPIVCSKCKGVGYHHGFGDNGHDPDWCTECGGIGEWEDDAMSTKETDKLIEQIKNWLDNESPYDEGESDVLATGIAGMIQSRYRLVPLDEDRDDADE